MISRRRLLAGILAAPAVAASCGGSRGETPDRSDNAGFAGVLLGAPLPKPTAAFTDTSGEPFNVAERTAGELTLLFFGYTSCPDVCPVHLSVLAGALDRLTGPAARANVAFVGVDTARDTPEVMRRYLDQFDQRFIGLTAEPSVIDGALATLKMPAPVIQPPGQDGSYSVDHASQIAVFTTDNLCHIVYPFGVRRQDWVVDLPRLVDIDWSTVQVPGTEGAQR